MTNILDKAASSILILTVDGLAGLVLFKTLLNPWTAGIVVTWAIYITTPFFENLTDNTYPRAKYLNGSKIARFDESGH